MTRNTVKTYCATYFILGLQGNLMIQSEELSRELQRKKPTKYALIPAKQWNGKNTESIMKLR